MNEPFDWLREQLGDDFQAALMADFDPAPRGPRRRPARRQPNRQPAGARPMYQGFQFPGMWNVAQHAAGMHQAQGNTLQNMANDVMGAIGRENQSRVAQLRERQRMMQAQQMKDKDLQALLARLQHERELAEMEMDFRREQEDRAKGIAHSSRWRKNRQVRWGKR